jgi:hypothetical protein
MIPATTVSLQQASRIKLPPQLQCDPIASYGTPAIYW